MYFLRRWDLDFLRKPPPLVLDGFMVSVDVAASELALEPDAPDEEPDAPDEEPDAPDEEPDEENITPGLGLCF